MAETMAKKFQGKLFVPPPPPFSQPGLSFAAEARVQQAGGASLGKENIGEEERKK
jgi:hypothetical protein